MNNGKGINSGGWWQVILRYS